MKLSRGLLISTWMILAGCVTINVYFPEAAAKKAADQFIDKVMDVPPAAPGPTKPAPKAGKRTPKEAKLLEDSSKNGHPGPDARWKSSTHPIPAGLRDARAHGSHGHLEVFRGALDWLVPAAYASDMPDVQIQTAAITNIRQRMQQRFRSQLAGWLDSGAIGMTYDGFIAIRNAASVPLDQRVPLNAAVADENRDRKTLYAEIASANGHPEWAAQIQQTFAKGWIGRARPGWYYQDSAGTWQKK